MKQDKINMEIVACLYTNNESTKKKIRKNMIHITTNKN